MIDVIFLIVMIGAIGVLLNPSVSLLVRKTVELGEEVVDVMGEEIVNAPILFGCLGLSILFAAIALVTIAVCIDRRCGKAGCKGLRKAAEFDLHLETEECVKNSNYVATNGLKKQLFELRRDHHRELEAELKKMAPPNGRAVLVFRARCGCSIGRMDVPGPKKSRKAFSAIADAANVLVSISQPIPPSIPPIASAQWKKFLLCSIQVKFLCLVLAIRRLDLHAVTMSIGILEYSYR
ncbi:unnamed protein product [Fraxinus pennsylvanica]|uniref:Ribosomal protein L34e superfamily protein n=1 Tax=Fraxinus pennsylvanica TaxID=56036 RepID=A0AAD1ZGY4_9LAMI|nr:unnamed protein product [Fraxinus pennsylvanica]